MVAYINAKYNDEKCDKTLKEILFDIKGIDGGIIKQYDEECYSESNQGVTFPMAMYALEKLMAEYNIQTVYTENDELANVLRWNIRKYPGIPIDRGILKKIKVIE